MQNQTVNAKITSIVGKKDYDTNSIKPIEISNTNGTDYVICSLIVKIKGLKPLFINALLNKSDLDTLGLEALELVGHAEIVVNEYVAMEILSNVKGSTYTDKKGVSQTRNYNSYELVGSSIELDETRVLVAQIKADTIAKQQLEAESKQAKFNPFSEIVEVTEDAEHEPFQD